MTLDRLRAYRSIELKLDRLREELADHYVCEPVSGSRGAPSFAKTTRYAEDQIILSKNKKTWYFMKSHIKYIMREETEAHDEADP